HGHRGAELWRSHIAGIEHRGTLVVASPRDQTELRRFAAATRGYERIGADQINALEPELSGRFRAALFFGDEAHMTTPEVLGHLADAVRDAGGEIDYGCAWEPSHRSDIDQFAQLGTTADFQSDGERSAGPFRPDWIVDCRGLAAQSELPELRGVRGERLVLHAPGVSITRPVRLLHPRQPLYVVPWSGERYLVGATVIESDDPSPMTVRSALDLLGLVYALHPGFGEASILELSAGVRPSFPDNVPRVTVDEQRRVIRVNGAYRHGFLLAPALAEMTTDVVLNRTCYGELVQHIGRGRNAA
ncbi:MAG: FAD-dependent oxidoreductase, partial [Pseudomonadota bacterium]